MENILETNIRIDGYLISQVGTAIISQELYAYVDQLVGVLLENPDFLQRIKDNGLTGLISLQPTA